VSGKRLSSKEKEGILNDIKRHSASFQSIAKKHSVSISTVSRLAGENGLSSPRKRTSAAQVPEHSYDRAQRISALDRMLNSIDTMVERGGLSSRQIKDLAGAAKEVFATRRAEDIEPVPEGKKEKNTVWLEEFAVPGESRGIGVDPEDPVVGRKMLEFSKQLDEGRDPFAERAAEEKAAREAARAAKEEESDG
jgi:transposase-like protein